MRVVQLGGTYFGAQKTIEGRIHHTLLENNYESSIFYAVGMPSSSDNIIKYENVVEGIVRKILVKVFGHHHQYARLQTIHALKIIEKLAPDIVHLHILHNSLLDYPLVFEFLLKRQQKTVVTLHDTWTFTGGCYHFEKIGCRRYMSGCLDCPKPSRQLDCGRKNTGKYLLMKLCLYSMIKNIKFVSVSCWLDNKVCCSMLAPFRHMTILNGVDSEMFTTHQSEGNYFQDINHYTGKKVILAIANFWSVQKGFADSKLLADMLGSDYAIALVGKYPKKLLSNKPENLHFLGYINDQNDLKNIYTSADILVSFSFEESFGMTFVEAALCGTRCIGYNSTAIAEVVGYVHGDVVDAGNVDEIAERIKYRTRCEVQDYKLTQQEIDDVKERLSSSRMSEEYLRLYEEMVGT